MNTAQASPTRLRIAIAGGGVIGMACAFELSRRGHAVTVFDPGELPRSTSWAAAGMIAPAYEVMLHGGGPDTPLARLCFESAALWPAFAKALGTASGLPVGYDRKPTLALARTFQEKAELERLDRDLRMAGHAGISRHAAGLHQRHGISSVIMGGLELVCDHQVDNRRLLHAFRANAAEGRFDRVAREVTDWAALRQEGFDAIVWARGRRERGVDGLIKGQALALQPFAGMPDQVLRFGSFYIVPKPDRIVIGATSEETYTHEGVSERATQALLDAAIEVLPALAGADLMEVWTGLRPRRASGLPLIGATGPGEYVAAAHFRNGILLAPATAARIADMIEDRPAARDAEAFSPLDAGATA